MSTSTIKDNKGQHRKSLQQKQQKSQPLKNIINNKRQQKTTPQKSTKSKFRQQS